ncbi:MAG: DUF2141 domain-containing protein [Bacteroidales bacterium]
MKLSQLILTTMAVSTMSFTAISAKDLTIKVDNVRNEKGKILVMATIAGAKEPIYQMAQAKSGEVTLELKDLGAQAVEVSLFHDENENFKMDMGERGPVEGYVTKKCKLKEQTNLVTVTLYYPN